VTSAAASVDSALSRDTRTALRNALKLSLSLVATWSIGLVVRFWLPRYLGPAGFGLLSFAEGLAATALACASLGLDTYIQKEIPVRPRHASEFYGGTVVLRTVLSALLVLGLLVVPLGSRPPAIHHLLVVFGIGYLVFSLNASLAALLQANATVNELAVANVATKVAWGVGMAAGILLRLPLVGFAAVFALSEMLKAGILQVAARRRLGLQIRFEAAATWAVVMASLGFYANSVAQVLGLRLDVTVLGLLAPDAEVGWYGAAQTLAGITLLLTPVLWAVLTPLFARAYDRSPEEMYGVLRRALEGIVAVAVPLALMLALGAELWIRIAFGSAYAHSVGSLRTLAPLFALVYVSIQLGTALIVQGRGWRLTTISLAGIVVHTSAALVMVPLTQTWLGRGGAGTGMAFAAVTKEVFVMGCMLVALGPGIIDRQRWGMMARTVLAAAGATLVHLLLAPLGPWRLLLDLGVYVALAVALGALRPRAVLALAREILSSRRADVDGSP
jgi:O-antigen/teichoic acid export membrane protein